MPFTLKVTPEAKKQIQIIMDDPAKKGLQKQLKKAFEFLKKDPRYPALNSHLLKNSFETYGVKVWTSYVQNKTPAAHRILWAYGDEEEQIVILAVIPHY